jgi:hypothetical protein
VVTEHDAFSHSIDAFLQRVAKDPADQPGTHGKRDSAGWLTSVLVHGVLIGLLAMVLAPIDLGGIDTHVLRFSFKDAEQSQPPDVVTVSIAEIESVPEEPAEPIESQPPPAAVIPKSNVKATDLAQRGEALRRGGDAGGSAGAAGSFFGIEARGRDFVYILDMSGSMRGRRFRCASEELVRSVEGLRESQNFYVLLFNGGTVRMFDGNRGYTPTPIPATRENKTKLSRWIQTAYRGGSTDPREALRLALRMRPSAIFMLSDGEFDDQKSKRGNMIKGNSGAFSIVAAASDQIPINAIAFEDPTSCENMKRLADMTNGEYRFAKLHSNAAAENLLATAQDALDRGDKPKALKLLREAAAKHGRTAPGREARQLLAPMVHEVAVDAINAGHLPIARDALAKLVEIDQEGDFSGDLQRSVVAQLLTTAEQAVLRGDAAPAYGMLAGVIDQFPKSMIAQKFSEQVAVGLFADARRLQDAGDAVQLMIKLDRVVNKFSGTEAAQLAGAEREKISAELLAGSRQLRAAGGDAEYADALRTMVVQFAGTQFESIASGELDALAIELLCEARDASMRRDWKTRDEANQRLDEAFSGDVRFARLYQQFADHEQTARALFRRAQRAEKTAKLQSARDQYADIVKTYPATIAAAKAQDCLRKLSPKIVDDDQELAELKLMMKP